MPQNINIYFNGLATLVTYNKYIYNFFMKM